MTPEDFGHWLHLATAIDGARGEMRHFVNGKPVAFGNFDPVAPAAADSGVTRNLNGGIDEFMLFARALSAEEIAQMK